MKKKNIVPVFLLVTFLMVWIILAINPRYREVWVAENILSVLLVGLLILSYHKFRFSDSSYVLIFLFLILHTIGGHYSYTEVPFLESMKASYAWQRNHYDRIVHLLFGFLFFFPMREFISRKWNIRGIWSYLLPLFIIAGLKATYEVLEYGYHIFAESAIETNNFLGMQGDFWDTQKDLLLGLIGSISAAIIAWCKERYL